MCLFLFVCFFWQWEKQVFSERTAESRQTLQDLQVPIEKLYRWATLQYHKQNLPGHSWWELFVIDCLLWCLDNCLKVLEKCLNFTPKICTKNRLVTNDWSILKHLEYYLMLKKTFSHQRLCDKVKWITDEWSFYTKSKNEY